MRLCAKTSLLRLHRTCNLLLASWNRTPVRQPLDQTTLNPQMDLHGESLLPFRSRYWYRKCFEVKVRGPRERRKFLSQLLLRSVSSQKGPWTAAKLLGSRTFASTPCKNRRPALSVSSRDFLWEAWACEGTATSATLGKLSFQRRQTRDQHNHPRISSLYLGLHRRL